jgi:hypothetical protein
MKDEVIRIILEAKDRLSNTVKNAERNINQSFGNIRNDLKRTDKDFNKFQNDFTRSLNKSDGDVKRWSNSIRNSLRSVQDSLARTRKDFTKPIDSGLTFKDSQGRFQSVRKRQEQERAGFGRTGGLVGPREPTGGQVLRQEIRDMRREIANSPVGQVFSSFRQGVQEAKQLEKELRANFADNEKQLKERKQALAEESTIRRELLRTFGDTEREILRQRQEGEARGLDKEIRESKEAVAREQDLRDERVAKRARKRKLAFDEEEYARTKELNDFLRARKKSTDDEIYKRQEALRKELRTIQDSSSLDPRTRQDLSAAAKKRTRDEIRALRDARDEDATARKEENIQINRENAAERDKSLTKLEDANANVRRDNAKALASEIATKKATAAEISAKERNDLSRTLRQASTDLERSIRGRRSLLAGQGEADLVKQFRDARAAKQAEQDVTALGRAFNKAGNAAGDFFRGLRRGRNDLRGIDKLTRAADSGFARFGQTVGKFTKNIGNLVNLRWYILISAIQVLGQLVLVLASNLISLASSAAIAASALGAGLAAAVSQAIPIVGLLAAAFSRVSAAFTAAQQANKANAQSSQDSRAQAQAQTAAQQGLTDALYNQKQAVQTLADARKQAARDIVDAIFAERDANFALKDAEFAVLDAKQRLYDLEHQNQQDQQAVRDAEASLREAKARLAAAKAQGDQAEIENAQVQLAVAQQNVADAKGQAAQSGSTKRQVAEQKLAVKEAQQQLEEARVAARRQREDTKKVVSDGVGGSKAVVDALHGVAQANRDVANAQQGVADASKKQASAGNLLQRQLSQLDPAERSLYKTFRRIYKQFKDTFRPITDIIVNAVNGAVKRFGAVLGNAQFVGAFRKLSRAIATGITDLSKFFTSKGFIHDFTGFIHAATNNIPTLIKIIENLASAFVGLAKAGQPIVKDLLGRFAGVTGSLAGAINSPVPLRGGAGGAGESPQRAAQDGKETRGQRFIANAKTYLDSWIKLADAIGRVFKYLFLDAAPSGNSLVNALTRMFNNLADFLKNNPQQVKKFFDGMVTSLKEISSVLFPLVKVLFSAFSGSNAAAFTKFTAEVVLPGLTLMLQFTSELAKILLSLSNIPGVKFFLQLLVAEKALNRVFPATQRVTDAVKRMGSWFFRAGEDGSRGFTKLRRAAGFMAQRVKREAKFVVDQFVLIGKGAKKAADIVFSASRRMVLALKNAVVAAARFVWEMTVAAVNAMKKFAIAVATQIIASLKVFAAFIYEQVVPALIVLGEAMYASLGPWGLIAGAIVLLIGVIVELLHHFHLLMPVIHAIGDAFSQLFNWIRDHWKLLLAILLGPFTLAFIGISKFKDKIFNFFREIISWIKNHWKLLAEILVAIFVPGGLLLLAIFKFKDRILHVFGQIWDGIKRIFSNIANWLTKTLEPHVHIHHWHHIPYPSITFGNSPDKAKDDNTPLSKAVKGPDGYTYIPDPNDPNRKRKVFAAGGQVPGKPGQAVPIVAHAGEWVLNKKQQMKAAGHLNMPIQRLKNFLFGGDPQKQRHKKQRQDAADMHHHRGDIHSSGGRVRGTYGSPVHIIAHAGEWVLNRAEQVKLARRFNEAVGRVATFLFGEPKKRKKEEKPTQTHAKATPPTTHKKKRKPQGGKFFPYNLVAETDDDGNVVYFIEDTQEQFLELNKIQALHTLRTNGKWTPGWIERYGYHLKRFRNAAEKAKGYAEGGIVGTNTPSFAMGGVVNSPQSSYDTSAISNVGGDTQHNKVEQHFKVHTKGETDWNYVMRLAAMHAESSF